MSARIGDTVLYRSWGTRDGRHQPADLPLLVVEANGDVVSGWVFYVDGMRWHKDVPREDAPIDRMLRKEPPPSGTWTAR